MLKREIRRFLASSFGAAALAVLALPTFIASASSAVDNQTIVGYDKAIVIQAKGPVDFNDENGTHEIDSQTGLPVDNDVTNTTVNPRISDNCYYDLTANKFVYSVGTNETAVKATVANGMIVSSVVTIEPSEGVSYTVYKNGTALEQPDLMISEPGSYTFEVAYSSGNIKLFNFRIVGPKSNLDYYDLPYGFTVLEVMMGGDYATFQERSVEFYNETDYIVRYRCDATNKTYVLETTIDRTPPTLKLSELKDGNKASGPVDISDIEPNCKVSISLDGKPIAFKKRLTDSGKYVINIEDQAGNVNFYSFSIMLYFTTGGIIFVIAGVLLVVGAVIYVIYSKNHMRIR